MTHPPRHPEARDRPRTLIRTPMPSQAGRVVDVADVSLNTEAAVVTALDRSASRTGRTHGVVLMVELGDLREGIALDDVPEAVSAVEHLGRPFAPATTTTAAEAGSGTRVAVGGDQIGHGHRDRGPDVVQHDVIG